MTPATFRLDGKRAVVTGGLGLLGFTIARSFVDAGATAVVVDNDGERWSALPVSERSGLTFFEADASATNELPQLVAEVDELCGGADIWVNCHYPRTADWAEREDRFGTATWTANVEMQMVSYCVISADIARRMARRGGGCLTNLASIYGVVGPDFSVYEGLEMTTPPPYAAIKGGIIAHSRYLATLWGPNGVRVNSVCPGGVANDQPKGFVAAYASRTPLRRLAESDEVAGPVVFLATEAASYITGATLMVDGGWTAQ